jgi:hypothetical protein
VAYRRFPLFGGDQSASTLHLVEPEPRFHDLYRDFLVGRIRDKFFLFALALILAAAVWQLAVGHVWKGLLFLAVLAATAAGIPTLLGISIAWAWTWRRRRRAANQP